MKCQAWKIVSSDSRLGESQPGMMDSWADGLEDLRAVFLGRKRVPTKENGHTGSAAEGQSAGGHSVKIAGWKRRWL